MQGDQEVEQIMTGFPEKGQARGWEIGKGFKKWGKKKHCLSSKK